MASILHSPARHGIGTAPAPGGIVRRPDGSGFVVGGVDDAVRRFVRAGEDFAKMMPPVALGHAAGLGVGAKPLAAGLAASVDGRRLLVANHESGSATPADLERRDPRTLLAACRAAHHGAAHSLGEQP